jgi:isopenicillin N synthase-like dioxygenase
MDDFCNAPSILSPKFILPKDKRPNLSEVTTLTSIPIIDFNDHNTNVEKIAQACEEYGFFQVINHGVSKELCDRVMTAITSFFELPAEEKSRFFTTDHSKKVKLFNYYLKVEEGQDEKVNMWSQSFSHPWHPQEDDFVHQLPQNPPQYREVFAEYANKIGTLMFRILSLISQGLGLEKDCLRNKIGENKLLRTQANYYPPCPDPELTLGLSVHTDLVAALNILMQSTDVSGLQVIKNEKWVTVEPIPNSFVVNLGDQLEVLSNGRFKSVHHRAVTNKTEKRISLAMFYGPSDDTVIGPVEDLIDEEHPRVYRDYVFKEFVEAFHNQEGKRRQVKEVFML